MKQVLNIAFYEILHIFKDKILVLLLFAMPLLYTSVLGMVYVSAILTNIPMGIVDLDHSRLSREIVSAFANSPRFKIINEISTFPQLEEGMRNGTIRAGVVIPGDFEKNASQHLSTEVLTVYDGSNLIWGYNIKKYTLEVINQFNTSQTASYLAGLGLSKREINNILDTISCTTEVWYNPTYSYATYLFMGLVMMILHQMCLLGVSLTVTRDKERNCWLQYLCTPIPCWKIFLGKSLPYFITNFLNYGVLIWFSFRFIHVKMEGSLPLVILLGLLYDLIITAAGFYISVKAPNSLQGTRFVMLLSVPFFFISGYTWPQTHIPGFINDLARLLPFTWMAEGFRLVTVKNLGVHYIYHNILALSTMAGLSITLAATFSKRRKPPVEGGLALNSGVAYPRRG